MDDGRVDVQTGHMMNKDPKQIIWSHDAQKPQTNYSVFKKVLLKTGFIDFGRKTKKGGCYER